MFSGMLVIASWRTSSAGKDLLDTVGVLTRRLQRKILLVILLGRLEVARILESECAMDIGVGIAGIQLDSAAKGRSGFSVSP